MHDQTYGRHQHLGSTNISLWLPKSLGGRGDDTGVAGKETEPAYCSIKNTGWGLSEPFGINSDSLLGQMDVFAYCQGDPCPERKNPGERQGVCVQYVYTAGKGI